MVVTIYLLVEVDDENGYRLVRAYEDKEQADREAFRLNSDKFARAKAGLPKINTIGTSSPNAISAYRVEKLELVKA